MPANPPSFHHSFTARGPSPCQPPPRAAHPRTKKHHTPAAGKRCQAARRGPPSVFTHPPTHPPTHTPQQRCRGARLRPGGPQKLRLPKPAPMRRALPTAPPGTAPPLRPRIARRPRPARPLPPSPRPWPMINCITTDHPVPPPASVSAPHPAPGFAQSPTLLEPARAPLRPNPAPQPLKTPSQHCIGPAVPRRRIPGAARAAQTTAALTMRPRAPLKSQSQKAQGPMMCCAPKARCHKVRALLQHQRCFFPCTPFFQCRSTHTRRPACLPARTRRACKLGAALANLCRPFAIPISVRERKEQ
jgi:hypothetical protein